MVTDPSESEPPRPLALVTGASSGIGAAVARELARRGHDLVLVARDEQQIEAVGADVETTTWAIRADLAVAEDLARVERVVGDRRPALVVNCAATGRHAPLQQQTTDDLDTTVAVDVLAPLRLTAAALRVGSTVLNVSSTASDQEVPDLAPYVAGKAFLESLSMSVSAGGAGVTVVRPGYTRTAFHRRLGEDVTGVPARLWMEPDHVARRMLDAHAAGCRRITLDVPATPVTPVVRAHRLARRVVRALLAGSGRRPPRIRRGRA